MGVVPPAPGFNARLASLCQSAGALLIMDEVLTGFRVTASGWYGVDGVAGDLVTFGKVMGGGLPCAAFGGRAAIMSRLAPAGPVYQAGTLSGNPLAMAAGLATLRKLDDAALYARLEQTTRELLDGLRKAAQEAGVPFSTTQVGSMFGLYFTRETQIGSYAQVMACDAAAFKRFFHAMLDRGV